MLSGIVEGVIIQQHRAQYGALGFNIRRQTADAGFNGNH
jgi:hypothetical protein